MSGYFAFLADRASEAGPEVMPRILTIYEPAVPPSLDDVRTSLTREAATESPMTLPPAPPLSISRQPPALLEPRPLLIPTFVAPSRDERMTQSAPPASLPLAPPPRPPQTTLLRETTLREATIRVPLAQTPPSALRAAPVEPGSPPFKAMVSTSLPIPQTIQPHLVELPPLPPPRPRIEVHIGKIEIRAAVTAAPPPAPTRIRSAVVPTLDRYLSDRSGRDGR